MEINIAHLFPELLNLYGDSGNIASLAKRLLWRGISVNVAEINKSEDIDFENTDIMFLGGGSDLEESLVGEELAKVRESLINYIENDGVLVAVCGGFQLLGKECKLGKSMPKTLDIIDAKTNTEEKRLIGNVLVNCTIDGQSFEIVGFENHSGRTYINEHNPLGKVIKGNGNNGTDGYEGVLYKNVFGTYLHGPLLPKNPILTDIILSRALSKKYPEFKGLSLLDDTLENTAKENVKEFILTERE